MSTASVTMYRVVCDWPGCDASPQDGDDYYAWADASQADERADDHDWLRGVEADIHYCHAHPAVWASDHEDGEPFPDPPYLLIHDGDTDDQDDDGRASLIGGAA